MAEPSLVSLQEDARTDHRGACAAARLRAAAEAVGQDLNTRMNRALLARLIDLVVVLFGVSVIVFLMIRLIPGDAVAIMLGANTEITPERARGTQRAASASTARWSSNT